MKSLRNLAFTAVLSMGALAAVPGSASAQTARGVFKLPHEVTWQGANVPAGEYQFSLDAKGPSQLMTVHQIDGHRASFMLLVNNTASAAGNIDRLILVSREGKKYVQSMELPEYGLIMRFTVPEEGSELALAGDHTGSTRLR